MTPRYADDGLVSDAEAAEREDAIATDVSLYEMVQELKQEVARLKKKVGYLESAVPV